MTQRVIERPIPILFKEILQNRNTGELIIRGENFQKNIFFTEGTLTFAKTTVIQERLGEILYKLGKIDQSQYLNLQSMIDNNNEKLGQILIGHDILNQKDVYFALLYQLRTIAVSAFSLSSGEWDFIKKVPDLPEDSRFKIELPAIISEGIKLIGNLSFYKNQYSTHIPQLNPIPKEVSNILSPEELRFYNDIRTFSHANLDQIYQNLNSPETFFWKKMTLLFLLDIVSFKEISQNIEVNKNIEELLDIYEKLKAGKINYYDLLGIANTASFNEIKAKYFSLAKKYHPDRITDAPDPDIKEKANFVFSAINKAYDTLSDDDKKRNYDTEGYKESEQDKKVHENLTEKARLLYLKAKTLYSQKKYWEAATLLEEAVKLDTKRSSYYLLLGMNQMNITSLRRAAEINLKKVTELDPWNAESFAALGLLFMSENMVKRAEGFFRKALSINPDHSLARKKLAEITGKKGKKTSLFGIFGKKK